MKFLQEKIRSDVRVKIHNLKDSTAKAQTEYENLNNLLANIVIMKK